jgi:hypothetical protein
MCFIVHKTTSKLECAILTVLYLTSAKKHRHLTTQDFFKEKTTQQLILMPTPFGVYAKDRSEVLKRGRLVAVISRSFVTPAIPPASNLAVI